MGGSTKTVTIMQQELTSKKRLSWDTLRMRSQLHEGNLSFSEEITAQNSSSAEMTPAALQDGVATSTDIPPICTILTQWSNSSMTSIHHLATQTLMLLQSAHHCHSSIAPPTCNLRRNFCK